MNITDSSVRIFISETIISVTAFIGITFFARELGPGSIGIFFLFQAVLNVLLSASDLGSGMAVEKRISEGSNPDDILATGLLLRVGTLSLIVIGILLLRGPLNQYIGAAFALHLMVAVVFGALGELLISVLQGELRVGETAVLNLIRHTSWVSVGFVLFFFGFGTEGLIYGLLFGIITMSLWAAKRVSIPIGRPSRKYVQSIVDFAKYSFLGSVAWQIHNWMDILIIGWLLTQTDVGTYEVAWRVAGVAVILSRAIAVAVLPQVSAWQATDATQRIEDLLRDAITPSLGLIIPAMFGVIVLSREILGILFGSEYTTGWLILIILIAGKLPEGIQAIVARYLQGLNRPDLEARATVVATTLNLVLNIVLISQFGLIGAAIATTVSYTAGTVVRLRYLSWLITIRFPYREVGWCILASVIMAGTIFWLRTLITIDSFLSLSGIIVVGVGVYTIAVLISNQLRTRVVNTARQFLA